MTLAGRTCLVPMTWQLARRSWPEGAHRVVGRVTVSYSSVVSDPFSSIISKPSSTAFRQHSLARL